MSTTQTPGNELAVTNLSALMGCLDSQSPALEIYRRMQMENFGPILDTAVETCGVPDEARAKELLDAFLQWLAVIPQASEGNGLQMFKEIDRIWHAMVLHTRFYRRFCDTYFACFIDHDPAETKRERVAKRASADYTLALLRATYGQDMNRELFTLENVVDCCWGRCNPDNLISS